MREGDARGKGYLGKITIDVGVAGDDGMTCDDVRLKGAKMEALRVMLRCHIILE